MERYPSEEFNLKITISSQKLLVFEEIIKISRKLKTTDNVILYKREGLTFWYTEKCSSNIRQKRRSYFLLH